jgi:CrcB protein
MLGYLQGLARIYNLPNWFVIGVGTGFIGAYTTFSTFSTEVVSYFQHGYLLLPVLYLLVSSAGGYILVYLGFALAANKRKEA